MEARLLRAALLAAVLVSMGASYRTQNFIVEAPTPALAEEIGRAAEKFRRELAIEWLGKPMPNWYSPCPITVNVRDDLGAGGVTSFLFEYGEAFGWKMNIQGSRERVLDSVLPHEVTHTIFASHFRRPLPRWADEGACTTVEHPSEKAKQDRMLIQFLRTGRGIAFAQMFAMKEYPKDVLPLYSQGYSLAKFLIQQGGKRKFLAYVGEGMDTNNWSATTKKHYGFANLGVLQNTWLDWVRNGSQSLESSPGNEPAPNALAANDRRTRPEPNLIYRGQSSDEPEGRGERLVPVPHQERPAAREREAIAAADRNSQQATADGWQPPRQPISDRVPTSDRERAATPRPPEANELTQSDSGPPAREGRGPRQVILEWARPVGE